MKSSFVIDEIYCNNEIFNLKSDKNRDNCFYPYFKLKDKFLNNGFNLSTCDINSIDESQIIIYNDMPKVLPKKKDISKSYLIILESELIKPNNWDLEKHKYFNKIFTWNDKIIDNKKYFKINFSHLFPKIINRDLSKKEKLCTIIAGNKKVNHPLELYSKRLESIRWFEKHHKKDFDFYGNGWDIYAPKNKYVRYILNKFKILKFFKFLTPKYNSYKGQLNSKKEVLEKYKFAICYENGRDIDGYITEKIFDCFFSGCIPIYWGANNITDHIPKDCFIDKREFNCYETLYSFINKMPDNIYIDYIENIEKYLFSNKSYKYSAEYFADNIVRVILNDIK